jgi:ABC-2 type transport system permease protein
VRIIDLALKDLSQLIRDWKASVFLLIMPIGFTLLFGFIFSSSSGDGDPRLPVGFLDADGGSLLSSHLLRMLRESESIRPVELAGIGAQEMQDRVGDEERAAAILIPASYTRQLLAPEPSSIPQPRLIVNPGSNAGRTAQEAIQAALLRLLGAVKSSHLAAQAYQAQGGAVDGTFLEEAFLRAMEGWQAPTLTVVESHSAAVEEQGTGSPYGDNSFAHSSAGIMIQFALAGLISAAEIVVLERRSGAMRRLLTTPISRMGIILGHFLAMFAMILSQLVVLVLFGQVFLGVQYLSVPLGTALMILVTAFWAASLGLLIGIFSRTQEQVIIFSLLVMMLLSGMGGAWIPLEVTSQVFQTIGHLTPAAWAIDGFENIVLRGLGFNSVLLPVAVLLGYAVVFFTVALWRFRLE